MGTRSGDLDPGLVLELLRQGHDVDTVDTMLNRKSGLAGVSGTSGDMRDIEAKAAEGDERCRLALKLFAHRLRKYIGAYAATMGGVDAIVFTAGIGQNSPDIRHRVAQRLDFLGARLDEDRNRDAKVDQATPVFDISEPTARVKLLVVATDEARAIAEHTAAVAEEADLVRAPKTIPIAVSARHIHLTQESVEALFGPGHTLTPRNDLSQPDSLPAKRPSPSSGRSAHSSGSACSVPRGRRTRSRSRAPTSSGSVSMRPSVARATSRTRRVSPSRAPRAP